MPRFSERQGYIKTPDIKYRDQLPDDLRVGILRILKRFCTPISLLDRIQNLLDPYQLHGLPERPNITVSKEEDDPTSITLKRVFLACEWYAIYDIIEDLIVQLDFYDEEFREADEEARCYSMKQALNDFFCQAGIGWQISKGLITARHDEGFEVVANAAEATLLQSGRPTAAEEIRKAVASLSDRPNADLRGAVRSATGALECLARDIAAQPSKPLGALVKMAGLAPPPLNAAIEKLWGFASDRARHVKEGVEPTRAEAELVVFVCAALIGYLSSTHPQEV